jgi:hypothetical protein
VFKRTVERAGITTGDVTLHTLRHTAMSRMMAAGFDDYTVMAISGHSSTRMLERYTHPVPNAVSRRSIRSICPQKFRTAKRGSGSCLFCEEFWPAFRSSERTGNGPPSRVAQRWATFA